MTQERLFASFVLDQSQKLEIALRAEHVTEATPIQGTIQKLPGSVDFLEGIMHLRDDVIPVINLKKRLGLDEKTYSDNAKVAVVSLFNSRYGLLFEDIKEVFRAEPDIITPINNALRTEDQAISALIKLEPGKRAVELLDLNHLFTGTPADNAEQGQKISGLATAAKQTTYSQYVIFCSGGQEYGISVDMAREITFCTEINDMFQTGVTAGAIELRGSTIPVINTFALLTNNRDAECVITEDTRVLVLSSDDCSVGLIVDQIKEIVTIADDSILPFPGNGTENVTGMFTRPGHPDTILLDVYGLVCEQFDTIKSMANIGNGSDAAQSNDLYGAAQTTSHHIITENCYLVFSIGRNFAIEIKDVKEIIENVAMMKVPGAAGCSTEVINLRGQVVPIINLRNFYQFDPLRTDEQNKLIICSAHGQTVALEVDQIVTIYKQEQFHSTPSLGKHLSSKKDTVDRLIEYLNDDGIKEHVLVLNIHNLIRNHLALGTQGGQAAALTSEEDIRDTLNTIDETIQTDEGINDGK